MVVKPMAGQERITDAEQATETGQGLQDPLARLRAEASIRVVGPRRRRNRVAVLAQTLESDIIPRLLMAHRSDRLGIIPDVLVYAQLTCRRCIQRE